MAAESAGELGTRFAINRMDRLDLGHRYVAEQHNSGFNRSVSAGGAASVTSGQWPVWDLV